MNNPAIQIACQGSGSAPLASFFELQGELKTLSESNYQALKNEILELGFSFPVNTWVDPAGVMWILDGHQRVRVLRRLEAEGYQIPSLPYCQVDAVDMTEAKHKLLAAAAQFGEANAPGLLSFIQDVKIDPIRLAALPLPKLDMPAFVHEHFPNLTSGVRAEEPQPADPAPIPEDIRPVRSQVGDLWVMGRHRLLCGDALNRDQVVRLLGGRTPDLLYTDPPYGVNLKLGKQNGAAAQHFHGSNSQVQGDHDTATAILAVGLMRTLSVENMILWGANYYASALPDRKAWIVWDKLVVGDMFSACELAWTSFEGRIRKFAHQWHGMIKASEHGEARIHPTQKPVALAEWCLNEFLPQAQTVLDLFGGSGSTLIACERTSRTCLMMEMEPRYIDGILTRWAEMTGEDPVREDGKLWSDLCI